MSALTIKRAEELVQAPTWADRSDYQRVSDRNDKGGVFIMDTATIVTDPFVTVCMEWQTDVAADGTVGKTLESLRVETGDDTAYIESAHLAHVVFVLCHAAVTAGVVR